MDSGTDTWVIVLAAFGGGLAGAVLQPLISYVLQLRTRHHDVEAEINQGLRRMLYASMAHVAKIAILANEVDSKQRHGLPPVATREKMVRLQVASNAPPAQMWRIKDDILRRLLDELDEASSTLLGLCFTPDDDEAVITIMDELMTDLPRKITLRMDELGWPEAHWEAAE